MQIIAIITPSKIPDACGVPPVPGDPDQESTVILKTAPLAPAGHPCHGKHDSTRPNHGRPSALVCESRFHLPIPALSSCGVLGAFSTTDKAAGAPLLLKTSCHRHRSFQEGNAWRSALISPSTA